MRARRLRLFVVAALAAGMVAVGGTPGPTRAEVTTPIINVLYGTLNYAGASSGYYRIGFEMVLPPQTVTFRQKFYSADDAPDDATFEGLPTSSPANLNHPNSPLVTMNGLLDPYQRWEANGAAGSGAFGEQFRWQLVLNGPFGEVKSDIITFTTLPLGLDIGGIAGEPAFLGTNPYAPGGLFDQPPPPAAEAPPEGPVVDDDLSFDVTVSAFATEPGNNGSRQIEYTTDDGATWAETAMAQVRLQDGPQIEANGRVNLTEPSASISAQQSFVLASTGFRPGTTYRIAFRGISPTGARSAKSPSITVTIPGGGTGGGTAGGGSGGGGTAAPRGEAVTAAVSPPASRTTPTSVQLTVPTGRVELRLTGLSRAAEASVTVIEPPATRGITFLPTAFDIDLDTTGTFTNAELCVPVDADELADSGVDATRLSLFHFDPNPVDITTRSSATEVCGITSSFSPFAVGLPATSRIAGTDRYDTAAQLVAQAFPGTATTVLVATGANFPDALAASAAAANADAPLLLVSPTNIPAATRTQLTRLRPQRIVIIGGTTAISIAVDTELARIATVERIAGTNRYDTAARIANRFFTPTEADHAYLVNGDNFPDALAAGAASSYTGHPVLLTQTHTLPTTTRNTLDQLGITTVTIVGGDNAISPNVANTIDTLVGTVTRIAGTNRYDTATRLANTITNAGTSILIATGTNFPDALGAAAVTARLDATLILTTPAAVPTHSTTYLNRRPPTTITILGGTNAITRTTETQLATTHLR